MQDVKRIKKIKDKGILLTKQDKFHVMANKNPYLWKLFKEFNLQLI